jgi:outer membrane protein assembly factor BamB
MAPACRFTALSSLILSVVTVAGCATYPSEGSRPAFNTDPVAPTPKFDIQWRRGVDTSVVGAFRDRQYAAPAVMRGSERRDLVVGTDSGHLFRLRASDAKQRWRREVDGPIHGTPATTGGAVFAGTLHGTLYAVDRQSGEVDWKIENDRGIEASPAASEGLVFYTTNAGDLVAVDGESGEEVWSYSRDIPKEFTIKGSGTPVVAGDNVYAGFADGTVAAIGKTTGEVLWETNVAGTETEFTDVDGPVFVEGNRLYVASYGAGLTALNRTSGETLWSRAFENVSSATYAEGTVYLTIATGRVVALDAEDGTGRWGFKMSEHLPVDIEPTGHYLFVSTGDGPLYVLDRVTGYPLRKWTPSSGINTAVAFSDDATYALSNNGYLYRLSLAF